MSETLIEVSYPVYMKCGHVSNRYKSNGEPCCSYCQDVNDMWDQPAESVPIVQGRTAICHVCYIEKMPSELILVDFRYRGEGSWVASNMCRCGIVKDLHRFGGYYPSDVLKDNPKPVDGICIHNGGHWREHGPYEYDLFYCGCNGHGDYD